MVCQLVDVFTNLRYYRLEQEEDSIEYNNDNYDNVTDIKEYYLSQSNFVDLVIIMIQLEFVINKI